MQFTELERNKFFATNETCLSINISDCEIIQSFFADWFGVIVFKVRLMLTGTLIFCKLNRRYSVLSGFTDSLFLIMSKKTSLMQDSIQEKLEANLGEKDKYI